MWKLADADPCVVVRFRGEGTPPLACWMSFWTAARDEAGFKGWHLQLFSHTQPSDYRILAAATPTDAPAVRGLQSCLSRARVGEVAGPLALREVGIDPADLAPEGELVGGSLHVEDGMVPEGPANQGFWRTAPPLWKSLWPFRRR